MAIDTRAIDGFGGNPDRSASVGAAELGDAFGPAAQSVLAALHDACGAVAPGDLIRELERAGFRNPDIRSAIWHLLDRHCIRLTRDLRLMLPVGA